MKAYGLLHVGENFSEIAPDSAGSLRIDSYVRNAVTLAASANAAGIPFAVLSNECAWVEKRLAHFGLAGQLVVIDWPFNREIPEGIAFRSAHHKIDVIAGFGTGALGDVVALLDLDMAIARPFVIPDDDGLYVYDIWAQVAPAYGAERIRGDLRLLGVEGNPSHWYGGEFIAGRASAFKMLADEIAPIWPAYVAALGSTHHTGDEMVVTAALLRISAAGVPLHDAGALKIVSRWWSARTLSQIAPLSAALEAAILHLPADKDFLADRAGGEFNGPSFVASYRAHAKRQRRIGMLKNLVAVVRGGKKQHLPIISA